MIAELAREAFNWPGISDSQWTNSRAVELISQIAQEINVSGVTFFFDDLLQNTVSVTSALAAWRALTAAFVGIETSQRG